MEYVQQSLSFHCFDKHLSWNRHAYFLFHVGILNSLRQCVDSRHPYTREIRVHLGQKKILWNNCQWLLSISCLPNLKSLFSGLVPFRLLNRKLKKLVISTKKCLSQVSFLREKDSLFKNLLFYFCHIPSETSSSYFWKAFWPMTSPWQHFWDRRMTQINQPSKKQTPLISGQTFLHQWCPLIRGSTVIIDKKNLFRTL